MQRIPTWAYLATALLRVKKNLREIPQNFCRSNANNFCFIPGLCTNWYLHVYWIPLGDKLMNLCDKLAKMEIVPQDVLDQDASEVDSTTEESPVKKKQMKTSEESC